LEGINLRHIDKLSKNELHKLLNFINLVQSSHNISLISEHAWLKLKYDRNVQYSHLLAENENRIIGYALIDRSITNNSPSVWILVDPFFNGSIIQSELLEKVIEIYGKSVRIWVHGSQPELSTRLSDFEFVAKRIILVMRIELSYLQLSLKYVQDIVIRNFVAGTDTSGWLALNRKIFKDHPEQGNWNINDLSIRINEKWFDEKGFFVVELNNEIIGSIWTKIHEPLMQNKLLNDTIQINQKFGEIYILAVAKKFQNLGIGKTLFTFALNYFKNKGIYNVILHVDYENKKAIKLYRDLGFLEFNRNILYSR